MHYVYLLESNGFYKIGITKNVEARIAQLQTGNPCKITKVAVCKTDKTQACNVEFGVLRFLKGLNVSGEWFRFETKHIDLIKMTFNSVENNDWSNMKEINERWNSVYREIYEK